MMHGGKTPAARANGEVRAAAHKLGLKREIHPHDAILEEVYRAAGSVAWLDDQIQRIKTDEMTWGVTVEEEKRATEFAGVDVRREAVLNAWVKLWQDERDRLTKVCKVAIDVGLDERRVRLAESQGLIVAGVIRSAMQGMLDALVSAGLTAALQQAWPKLVAEVVPRELRAITAAGEQT